MVASEMNETTRSADYWHVERALERLIATCTRRSAKKELKIAKTALSMAFCDEYNAGKIKATP